MTDAPDTLDKLQRDLGRAVSIIDARRPGYVKAREYDRGERAELGGSRVADRIIEQGKATPISFAHVPVDVISEKVNLSSLTSSDAAAAADLERWSDANDLEDESEAWIREACVFGDFYVITDPGSYEEGSVDDIRSVGIPPTEAVVVYDRQTRRTAEYGLHVWSSGTDDRPETSALLYYDDATVALVAAGMKDPKPEDFVFDVEADQEDEDAYTEHDGDRLLITHLAIGSKPYGTPIHKRAWAFQDAIAKISANNLVNVEAEGLPSRWALLDPAAEVDDDIDEDFGTDGSITASLEDGQTTPTKATRVRTIPGAIAMLRGIKQTGTYDQGDSSSFLANLDWYVRGMAVACGVPLFEFDMAGEQPSGEARRRAESRVNRKAEAVQRQAGAFFREIGDTVIGVLGKTADVDASFAPIETSTDKEGIELVGLKIKNGVPVRKALAEAGYTETQIEEWMPKSEPAYTADLLAALADVLQKLGQAQTLGAITAEEVAAMLPDVLTGPRGEGSALPVTPPAPGGGLAAIG